MDFYGKQLWQKQEKVKMMANTSKIIFSAAFENTLKPYDKNKVFLHVEIRQNDSLLAENNLFFVRTKDLVLPKPHLQYKITKENGRFGITITSKVFVKYVVLNYPDDKGVFSDNYFALLPGQSKTIRINLKNAEKEFHKKKKIESLY